MPGPGGSGGGGGRSGGGGGRGGSFGGGGFSGGRGGGFGGGGFHGGPRPGGMHHHHHMGGWHFGPRYRGGGCLGGFLGVLIVPIFVIILLLNIFMSGADVTYVQYDEEVFQDYADERYAEVFGSSADYEDNLLLVFLVDEDHYTYYYISWVGDHVVNDVSNLLGSNNALGRYMDNSINESNYKYSLDSDLAYVMEQLSDSVSALGLSSSFDCGSSYASPTARFINDSELSMTDSTVENAIAKFTAVSGIPTAIVVDDVSDVFGTDVSTGSGSRVSVGLIIAVVVIIAIVAVIIYRKNKSSDDFVEEEKRKEYRKFDDQY